MGGDLVVVGQSGCQVVDGDVMAHFPLVTCRLHLQPGDDVLAVGSEADGHGADLGGDVVDVGDGFGIDEAVLDGDRST